MAVNFNKPEITDNYASLLPGLVDNQKALAVGLDPLLVPTPSNVPAGAIRWNSSLSKWEKYSGTVWGNLSSSYAISISGGNAGELLYQSASGVTAKLSSGTLNYILKSGGPGVAPSWISNLPIANGGTGGTTAATARTNLGADASGGFPGLTQFAINIKHETSGTNNSLIRQTNTASRTYSLPDSSGTIITDTVLSSIAEGVALPDSDRFIVQDSTNSFNPLGITWLTIKGYLQTYLQDFFQDKDTALSSKLRINSQPTSYTTVLDDRGKCILLPVDAVIASPRTFTINGPIYGIGDTITVCNRHDIEVYIAMTGPDIMTLAGTIDNAQRTLHKNGIATILKVESQRWVISGVGLI